MDQPRRYKLKILAGVHKDAELRLNPYTDYRIGSNDECDIILMDDGIEAEHLHIRLNKDHLEIIRGNGRIFVDGKSSNDREEKIKEFQILTLGNVHMTIGPADEEWPMLVPPILEIKSDPSDILALVPVYSPDSMDHQRTSRFNHYLQLFTDFISHSNKKILVVVAVFSLFFFIFWIDFMLSAPSATADDNASTADEKPPEISSRSHILSFLKVMMQVREETLVGTGVEEPPVKVEKEIVTTTDPAQQVREVLKENWGPSLTETPKEAGEIEFRSQDAAQQTDMALTLNKDPDGTISAQGFTLSRKQRKEMVAQLGDVIRLKVIAADDLETLCQKTLKKKKIRRPSAEFDLDHHAVTLRGESDDHKLIADIEEIIHQTVPNVKVDNQISYIPEKLEIVGVNTNGIEYVTLSDGSKVFPGGKLKNGCVLKNILPNGIQLNCHGSTIFQKIGENS